MEVVDATEKLCQLAKPRVRLDLLQVGLRELSRVTGITLIWALQDALIAMPDLLSRNQNSLCPFPFGLKCKQVLPALLTLWLLKC